jgi:hypothetical protein
MKENFDDEELKDIFYHMKRVEPAFNYWSENELNNLTQAIYKCGYIWERQDKDVGFFHPKNELILNFKGLHLYSPDSILSTYESIWSKDNIEKKKNKQLRMKRFKSFWIWIFSFLLLFFIDIKYACSIIFLLFVRFIYYSLSSSLDK